MFYKYYAAISKTAEIKRAKCTHGFLLFFISTFGQFAVNPSSMYILPIFDRLILHENSTNFVKITISGGLHMKELNNIKIIAVDHGYGNIKTANTVTPTGITAYDTEPVFLGNISTCAVGSSSTYFLIRHKKRKLPVFKP